MSYSHWNQDINTNDANYTTLLREPIWSIVSNILGWIGVGLIVVVLIGLYIISGGGI